MAAVIHGKDLQGRTFALAKHLPGNDIRVMLRFRNDDFIPGPDKSFPETECDQVDRSGGAGGKNDLFPRPSIQVIPDKIPRRFVFLRSQGGQVMDRAVQVGIDLRGHLRPLAHHGKRTLRRSRVVQIDQRLAVNPLPEFGEFLPYFFDLHHREMQI